MNPPSFSAIAAAEPAISGGLAPLASAAPSAAAALLPGLGFALLAGLLGLVLHRVFDPLPMRSWGVHAGLLLLLFGPTLFAGQALIPFGQLPGRAPFLQLDAGPDPGNRLQVDPLYQMAPWRDRVHASYDDGVWPLWNPHAGAGEPLWANPQALVLQPLTLVTQPFDATAAAAVVAALRVLLALVFGELLLRRLGFPEGAARAGAVAHALGGFVLLWLQWPLSASAALTPLVLYATLRAVDRGAPRDRLLLAGATMMMVQTGHPETIFYAAVLAGLFAIARARQLKPTDQRWRRFGATVGVALLGALLAAPVLLPTALFMPQTQRYHALQARALPTIALDDVARRAQSMLAPVAFGHDRFGPYWGDANINQDAAHFVGTAALLGVLLGLGTPRALRGPHERAMQWITLGAVVIALQPPGLPALLDGLPIVGASATYHRRLLMVVALGTAYLGACTWARWSLGRGPSGRRIALTALGLGAAIAAIYALQTMPSDHPMPGSQAALAPRGVTFRWTALLLHGAALAGSAALLARRPTRAQAERWALLLVVPVVLELLPIHAAANPSASRALEWPVTPALERLLARAQPGARIAGFGDTFYPNLAALYGLEDARSFHPARPVATNLLLDSLKDRPGATADLLDIVDHPILDLLGVRYILTRRGADFPPPLERVFRHPSGFLFARPRALPRIWMPFAVEGYADRAAWRARITEIAYPRRRALVRMPDADADVDEDDPASATQARGPVPWTLEGPRGRRDPDAVRLLQLRAAHVVADATLTRDRWVAASIHQDGGWRLLREPIGDDAGRPRQRLTVVEAYGALQAAWVPAGRYRLHWLYRPPGLLAGTTLAALAAALLLGVALPRPPARRD
ncbi:MAG: hypothetical protein AAF772_16025 [Acidobacteriota bacterium]